MVIIMLVRNKVFYGIVLKTRVRLLVLKSCGEIISFGKYGACFIDFFANEWKYYYFWKMM
jgi:hypothetical protein